VFIGQYSLGKNGLDARKAALYRPLGGFVNLAFGRFGPFVDGLLAAAYHQLMRNQVIIEELPYDPEFARLSEQGHRNMMWFNDHVEELGIFKHYRGRYVAALEGELLVADTPQEIHRLVREKHPDGLAIAHVRYIPREKMIRIYAC